MSLRSPCPTSRLSRLALALVVAAPLAALADLADPLKRRTTTRERLQVDPKTVVELAFELRASHPRGDLGPDWQTELSFGDYTGRFELKWSYAGPHIDRAVYVVEDPNGNTVEEQALHITEHAGGLFLLRLADLPKRPLYTVRVVQTGADGSHTGRASNAVTLRHAEPEPIPFHFASFYLDSVRENTGVPGIGSGVTCRPGDAKEWWSGIRRQGSTVKVQADDRWHIGSDTKAITATMVGKLVEEGRLSWSDTIWVLANGPRNLFPEIRGNNPQIGKTINQHFMSVTVEHLASHRSGMVMTGAEDGPTRDLANYSRDPRQFRWQTVRSLLTRPHGGTVGEWRYGHGNYMLLGVIIERIRGAPYEQVIEDEIFAPLGMTTASFGMPTDAGVSGVPAHSAGPWAVNPVTARDVNTTVQPNGHLHPGRPKKDNLALPPVWNPAGGAYMSVDDWLRFLRLHLDGRSGSLVLKSSTLDRLHSAFTRPDRRPDADGNDPSYGFGWGIGSDGKYGRVLGHDGTYFRFYATASVYLDRGFAVVAASNVEGGEKGPGDDAAATMRNWLLDQSKQFCKSPSLKDAIRKATSTPKTGSDLLQERVRTPTAVKPDPKRSLGGLVRMRGGEEAAEGPEASGGVPPAVAGMPTDFDTRFAQGAR